MIKTVTSPIIIIGMHRSGTTLMSRVLESIGVEWGWKRDNNNESRFFIRLNEEILGACSASWDRPDNINFIDDFFETNIINYLKDRIFSRQSFKYWGSKYLVSNFRNYDKLWGWKDPRTTLTIDLWLKIFPEAKIIHLYRHPIDVALSLRNRHLEYEKLFSSNNLNKKKVNYIGQGCYRCLDLLEGVKLWEFYVDKALKVENCLHVKYEDMILNSNKVYNEISDFLGVEILRDQRIFLNKERAYAFKNIKIDKNVLNYIESSSIAKQLGY